MVVKTEKGSRGANNKYYATAESAHRSFRDAAQQFKWPEPQISVSDRTQERLLRVFLAQAKEDKPSVRQLYERLRQSGVDPWLDEAKLIAGQKWRSEISNAIRATDVSVACLSQTAGSKIGYVNREFKEALELADEQPQGKIFLIPPKLQECEVPDRFREIHWVDYFKPDGFRSLMKALAVLAKWLQNSGSEVKSVNVP